MHTSTLSHSFDDIAIYILYSIYIVFILEAIRDIKTQYFSGDDVLGYEPVCGTLSVADGTVKEIGHLMAASICNGGPAPDFFPVWIYKFIVGGIHLALKFCPMEIESSFQHSPVFNKVYTTLMEISKNINFKYVVRTN